jgi:hypothetical protein
VKFIKPFVVFSFLFAFVANTAFGFNVASNTFYSPVNKKITEHHLHLKAQTFDLLYFLEEDLTEELEEGEAPLHFGLKFVATPATFSFCPDQFRSQFSRAIHYKQPFLSGCRKEPLFIVYQVFRI